MSGLSQTAHGLSQTAHGLSRTTHPCTKEWVSILTTPKTGGWGEASQGEPELAVDAAYSPWQPARPAGWLPNIGS